MAQDRQRGGQPSLPGGRERSANSQPVGKVVNGISNGDHIWQHAQLCMEEGNVSTAAAWPKSPFLSLGPPGRMTTKAALGKQRLALNVS